MVAEYQSNCGERYVRGLAILTFPFNLCANVALLSLKGSHLSLVEASVAVNTTATNEDVLIAGTCYNFITP